MATTDTDTDKTTAAKSTGKPKGFVWVINNEARHRILNLKAATNAASKSLSPGPAISLIPGASVIDARLWRRWKDENPDRTEGGETVPGMVTQLLTGKIPRDQHAHRRAENAGQPFLVEGPAVASLATPLADVDEGKARELVEELFDEARLRQLLAIERRASVAEALRSAINKFERANAEAV